MKKFIILQFIILLGIINFSCKKEVKPIIRKGIVNFIRGDVTVIVKNNSSKAKIGDELKEGAKLITGKKSSAEIYFGKNAIKVIENSNIEIKSLINTDGSDKTELFVKKGGLFSQISQKLSKGDEFRVKTPTTVAAIRGTDFLVEENNGKGKVSCIEGKVAVKDIANPDKEVFINAGEEVSVEKDKPLFVEKLKKENLDKIKAIKAEIKELREDIRRQFKEDRDAIRNMIKDEREKNKEMVKDQKESNKKNVSDQKDTDKKNIEKIKGDIDGERNEAKKAVEDIEKPTIEKPTIDIETPTIEKPSID